MLVSSKSEEKLARRYLDRAGVDARAVEFIVHPTNRGWTRDSGPLFVRRNVARRLKPRSCISISTPGPSIRLAQGPPGAGDSGETARETAVHAQWKDAVSARRRGIEVNGAARCSPRRSATGMLRRRSATRAGRKEFEEVLRNYLGVTNISG